MNYVDHKMAQNVQRTNLNSFTCHRPSVMYICFRTVKLSVEKDLNIMIWPIEIREYLRHLHLHGRAFNQPPPPPQTHINGLYTLCPQ